MDIRDTDGVTALMKEENVDAVMHLAAESHVDRSISGPMAFLETNIMGTASMLSAARAAWADSEGGMEGKRFHHVSTDEVYGSLGETGFFTEETAYDPRSPYSASKASSDHIVRAWHHTYGMPVVLSNCSNNYGSFQFPEKLIPLFIRNAVQKKPLPVYGQGVNVRDWLWVEDHAAALEVILTTGANGETYNIGGENEWRNIDLIRLMCRQLDAKLGRNEGETEELITYVTDRAGHDMRYAIDPTKLREDLGWRPSITFEEGLAKTIDWYLANDDWLEARDQRSVPRLLRTAVRRPLMSWFARWFRPGASPATSADLEPLDLSAFRYDFHSHLVPGVDDGAPDLAASLEMIDGLVALGYEGAVTTPHVMAGTYPNDRSTLEPAFRRTPPLRRPRRRSNRRWRSGRDVHRQWVAFGRPWHPAQLALGAEYFLDDSLVDRVREGQDLLIVAWRPEADCCSSSRFRVSGADSC